VVVHSLRLFDAQLAADTEAFAAPVHAPDFKSARADRGFENHFRVLAQAVFVAEVCAECPPNAPRFAPLVTLW
jgi:hypothetical protein